MIQVFYWQASAGSLTCWWGLPRRLQGQKIQRERGTVDGGLWCGWVMGNVSAHHLCSKMVPPTWHGRLLLSHQRSSLAGTQTRLSPKGCPVCCKCSCPEEVALPGWTIHLWRGCLVELSWHRQRCFACLLSFWCPSSCMSVLLGLNFPGMLCFWRFLLSFFSYSRQGGDRNPVMLFSPSSPLGPVSPRSLEGPIRVSACVERCPEMFLFLLCLLCLAWYLLK